jgi:hypothetical protein
MQEITQIKKENADPQTGFRVVDGKAMFVTKTEPFERDGKLVCRVISVRTKERDMRRDIMRANGLKNGKQYRKFLAKHRKVSESSATQ